MNKTDISQLADSFNAPGNKFRGAPFWAWNDHLETTELRRQIRLMHEMGMGGFFMHARVGLGTAYLSDEWFQCVSTCIDEAEKFDMQVWLYDEDRWPSGSAGGLVTADPKYRARKIILNELSPDAVSTFKPSAVPLAIFAGKVAGRHLSGLRRLDSLTSKLQPGETLLHFQVEVVPCKSWFNGQTYLDTLSHEAVRKFITVTHEEYRKRIGGTFGKRVPGIFTDEPHYGLLCNHENDHCWSSPWTDRMPKIFRSRYGYDLCEHLPELFYDLEGNSFSKARLNFVDCLTFLFVDAFSRQIGEWCSKNNMLFTGHVIEEDSLRRQTFCIGSAMRFYEYMQAPGIDLLTEHWRVYDTAKQLSSVAHQFDRQWRVTETYGCTGWDFPFSGHKALGDWQAALGINMRCHHLAWYTMKAEAKRDYPASIFYQSPWFREYRHVEDYFSRINFVMGHGSEVRDLLVILPVESAWTLARKDWNESREVLAYDRKLFTVRNVLLQAGLDFDYGEEDIMSRHAGVVRENGTPVLYVGKAAYKIVVVPEMITIRASTVKLLKDFAALGGKVIFVNKAARYVDGEKTRENVIDAVGGTLVKKAGSELVAQLESTARNVSITDGSGTLIASVLHLLRRDECTDYLFLCNTGHHDRQLNVAVGFEDHTMARNRTREFPQVSVMVKTDKNGTVLDFDPETGKIYQAQAENVPGGWRIFTSLPALGSRLFVIAADKQKKYPVRPRFATIKTKPLNPTFWNVRRNEDNVIVFDCFKARIDSGKSGDLEYCLTLDDRLRKLIGCEPRGGDMVQPWVKRRDTGKTIRVRLTMNFGCDVLPSGALYLALEAPELYNIKINGNELLPFNECGWWCDKSLRKLAIEASMIYAGNNEITLECDYNGSHPGLEMVYLLGNFGVTLKDRQSIITSIPDKLKIGDWCRQGLPFYSGSLIYSSMVKNPLRPGERLFVTLPDYRGACIRILIDGVPSGLIAWPPQELDLTDFIPAGRFELGIEVIGSRRNSHGPFHCRSKWPNWTGPGEFKQYDVADYQLVPSGLLQAPVMEVRN